MNLINFLKHIQTFLFVANPILAIGLLLSLAFGVFVVWIALTLAVWEVLAFAVTIWIWREDKIIEVQQRNAAIDAVLKEYDRL